MRKNVLIIFAILLFCGIIHAQSDSRQSRQEYFEMYKDLAIKEMKRSGVPASITLAQGALESGDGNSSLARRSNNHFGIKCHDDWNGKTVYQDDDEKNECFRKYPSVEDSYRDHSDYLRSTHRYDFLFDLDPTDYKGWARGLKRAGYATSSTYAERLIQIIEDFDLNKYDRMEYEGNAKPRRHNVPIENINNRQVLENNRVKYIIAQRGDTYESLSSQLGKLEWELPNYNETETNDSLTPGQKIYIQPKRNKAQIGNNTHEVQSGETMHDISQEYAIKLSKLYAMNLLEPGNEPAPGTILQLRHRLKGQMPKPLIEDQQDKDNNGDENLKFDLNLN